MICTYTRGLWIPRVVAQNGVLVAALAVAAWRGGAMGSMLALGIGASVVWALLTLHFPSKVELTDDVIAFFAYGRVHVFPWRDVTRLSIRRFLVRDRVLIRLAQTLPFPWLRVYIVLSSGAMWALIALAVHAALAGSRLIAEPRRYALRLNLFDLRFLEPVARESLLGALFFIGGITISLFFTPLQDLLHPVNIAIYSILLIVIVVMFFQTMNGTHRLLVDVKQGELDYVRQQLATTYQQLRTPPAGATADGQAAATLHAWLALEQRLLAVPEWPYNPDTIRNLIVSILVPILSVLARLLWPGFF